LQRSRRCPGAQRAAPGHCRTVEARPDATADDFPEIIADSFPEATILFAGLHDFSRLTDQMAAPDVVKLLNEIYSGFDTLIQKHGLEKIKIIGESYMVAAGVPVPRSDHAEAIAEAALGLQQEIVRHDSSDGETFSLRIGINTGPVVAGVIGKTKFSYDVWGETVNTAWHMETYGAPGYIQVNETTHARLGDKYAFEDRGEFYVKDKGELKTYFLKGRNQFDLRTEFQSRAMLIRHPCSSTCTTTQVSSKNAW
jgi:class 3 adenylate cyclase